MAPMRLHSATQQYWRAVRKCGNAILSDVPAPPPPPKYIAIKLKSIFVVVLSKAFPSFSSHCSCLLIPNNNNNNNNNNTRVHSSVLVKKLRYYIKRNSKFLFYESTRYQMCNGNQPYFFFYYSLNTSHIDIGFQKVAEIFHTQGNRKIKAQWKVTIFKSITESAVSYRCRSDLSP
jgi:hypothetical protein